MKRGCTQCGECLNVCPVYNLYKREEYSPKGKRLLLEPLDAEFGGGEEGLPWEQARRLARMCAGCERCLAVCRRKLSTCELLADVRSTHPHWTQALWNVWIRRAGPLWPLAGRIAMMAPQAIVPQSLQSSLQTARALVDNPPCAPWVRMKPREQVHGIRVSLFAGCTAKNARPKWIAKAEALLRTWGYIVVDAPGFTCCGGTLHHAGQFDAQTTVREQNIAEWTRLEKPLVVSFCASCKHSLDGYAAAIPTAEGREWKEKNVSLSSLLTNAELYATSDAPDAVGYHQPCHWLNADPDMPWLQQGLSGLKKGTGLCCGMGGILKMSNPDLSADMATTCLKGMDPAARNIITGCSGCVMQLASVAPEGTTVRHWLDVVEPYNI